LKYQRLCARAVVLGSDQSAYTFNAKRKERRNCQVGDAGLTLLGLTETAAAAFVASSCLPDGIG
jgi:hypothetical protein